MSMKQLRREYRAATLRKVIKVTKDGENEIKTKTYEVISPMTFTEFAKREGKLEMRKAAHKEANKPRSAAKKERTRAATQANREARQKRSNNNKAKVAA